MITKIHQEREQGREHCDLLFVFKTRRKLCLWEDTQKTGNTGCLVGREADDREQGWGKGGWPYISFYIVNFET